MSESGRLPSGPSVVYSLFTLAYLALLASLAAPAAAYQQQMQTAAERVGEAMARGGKRTLAVVDFTDLQGNTTELGRFLAEQLSIAIGATGGNFEAIDRNHLRAILEEHQLSATGLVDPLTARKVGQMVGAECLVSGSITAFSESVNVSIKLLDTNTARILGGVTVDIPRTSTINELLARGISTQLVSETPSAGSRPMPASPSGAKASVVTEVAHGVEVSIGECKRSGRAVTCNGTLRNGTEGQLHVNFLPGGGAEVIDNLANRSRGRAVFSSRGDWELDLEPDLPVKFWVDNVEVAPEAASLTARITVGVRPGYGSGRRVYGGSGGQEVVVLRNIPIR